MSLVVVSGASCQCTFGLAPSCFQATTAVTERIDGKVVGTVMDGAPIQNIKPFGVCITLSNPAVAAATAAALGVLTPQPCIPVTQKWTGASTTMKADGQAVITQNSTCTCSYGGVITVSNPGQTKCDVR
jgi:hypothetical protein